MHKLKSTKLWLALFMVAIVTALNYFGTVDSTDYIDFLKWIFGLWIFGNVTTKAVSIPANKQRSDEC